MVAGEQGGGLQLTSSPTSHAPDPGDPTQLLEGGLRLIPPTLLPSSTPAGRAFPAFQKVAKVLDWLTATPAGLQVFLCVSLAVLRGRRGRAGSACRLLQFLFCPHSRPERQVLLQTSF